ncbi:MAG: preprotein translocase subunit SecD [Methanothrix sp.]|jgi:preprotein translocase subunit SecD|uniref:Protein-export membrane protein SecD n=1 Tax=Methanothrix harundinacea TaxID=301375 RepID=A0A101IIC5_9EURY|nr:MAG: Protein-export membrane protein SecD [Methanothrix harundinacea]MDD3710167.1 preprotein translocase subunit SecD [Methanothrix sp.]MDI9400233.1 preprotein translocase subunit SecD [Euryarchaeota archaeon]KUK95762.1 MAG: Protein-export membrane protein SecD [Methanothrix harundinacea]MCP1392777.1 preprotein translocase subunit SecD [Methanothrix harundinacea]
MTEITKDPRVMLFFVAVAASLIILAPMPSDGGVHSRLKYGLDLEGGSWLQLKLQGAIVQPQADPIRILEKQFGDALDRPVEVEWRPGSTEYTINVNGRASSALVEDLGYSQATITPRGNATRISIEASPVGVIMNYLKISLDADVKYLGSDPLSFEVRSNVTREDLEAILAQVGGTLAPGEAGFSEGVTEETVDETKQVLDRKLNRLGLQDIKVRVVDNKFILIDLAGVSVADAQEIVGKPGVFEIRIQTKGNESIHVLYGDAIVDVSLPQGDQSGNWGVPFTLSEEGAISFQKAAIDTGATRNRMDHEISMHLDDELIFSAPLAQDLAASLEVAPMRNMVAQVGGESQRAHELYIHLREGALPVNVEIIGSGQVTAALGDQFKKQVLIAGIMAILAVGLVVYFRYREPKIVIPMVATSFSEVLMMLALAALLKWQLDLASIAGIIAVIGTGVDHLVIITDELLYEGKMPSGKVYLARLSSAFGIIMAAAATTIVAMLPLFAMGFGAFKSFALITIAGVLIGVFIARPAYGRIIGRIMQTGD